MYLYIVLIRIFFFIKSEIIIIIKFNKFKKGFGFFFFGFLKFKIILWYLIDSVLNVYIKNYNLFIVILRDIFLF